MNMALRVGALKSEFEGFYYLRTIHLVTDEGTVVVAIRKDKQGGEEHSQIRFIESNASRNDKLPVSVFFENFPYEWHSEDGEKLRLEKLVKSDADIGIFLIAISGQYHTIIASKDFGGDIASISTNDNFLSVSPDKPDISNPIRTLEFNIFSKNRGDKSCSNS